MQDVHTRIPSYQIEINRVGVSGLSFPLTIKKKDNGTCVVEADFAMFGSLLKEKKGIDMSRFPETLMEWTDKPLSAENFEDLARQLQVRVQADDIYISASFNYSMPKITPVTNIKMIMYYECKFAGWIYKTNYYFFQEVNVPITSVCPCSKDMCLVEGKTDIGKGAHNQRGIIKLELRENQHTLWLEDLIKVCETSGSCEIYSLLKRPDEKYVTEVAYSNPKFVEDIAREVAGKIIPNEEVCWFRVKVENFESIHNHSATCYIEKIRKGKRCYTSNRGFI
jgi:GTP cyclohydrolase I